MATIKRREGKNGASYLIRSSCGYDVTGKQIMRSMTWRPKPGMTEKQIEKELNRQAVLFDEKCSAQGIGGGNVKFETFSNSGLKNMQNRISGLGQLIGYTSRSHGFMRLLGISDLID